MNLLEQLARRALRPKDTKSCPIDWKNVGADDVRASFERLAEHRLEFLCFVALTEDERTRHLSADLRTSLNRELEMNRNRQSILGLQFAQVCHALHSVEVTPIACKGIVLARDYYRPLGVRLMNDVDLWIPRLSIDRVREALGRVGYRERPDKETHHALYFEGPMGVLLDVHHRMGLFEDRHFELIDLSVPVESGWHRVFVPEALLAHLIVHLLGHAPSSGILLGWIADIAVVLDRHGESLDWSLVRRLCPSSRVWTLLLRTTHLCVNLGWTKVPSSISSDLNEVPPLSFDSLMRLRRLAPLRLLHARGWLGLIKHIRHNETGVPLPPLKELPQGFKDLIVEGTPWVHRESALLTGSDLQVD